MLDRTTDTVPKLDRVEYLFDTLGCVQDHLSFEKIRKVLINLRPRASEQGTRITDTTFWSNARDALRELMRLGLVDQATLPSRPAQLDAHRSRSFTLTEEGTRFLDLEQRDVLEFRHRFAQAMLLVHPYLRELHHLTTARELFFPRLQRSELPGDAASWKAGPPEPLLEVASWIADAMRDVVGLELTPENLENQMRPHLNAAWKRLDFDQKGHLFTKAIVKAFNDVLVRVLLRIHGTRMDFVTFRSAVALLSDLGGIWHTRSVPGRRGWTVWATSAAPVPLNQAGASAANQALQGPIWFSPQSADAEAIRDALIELFFSLPDRRGGFALIHVLRAQVCHRLRIHGRDFDKVLRQLHSKTLSDATYAINLDRGGGDEVPPSEEPFRSANTAFYLITLLKRSDPGSI